MFWLFSFVKLVYNKENTRVVRDGYLIITSEHMGMLRYAFLKGLFPDGTIIEAEEIKNLDNNGLHYKSRI